MIVEVIMYGQDDEPVAKALVESDSLDEAHSVAMRIMKKQYPDLDPEKYNQTIASSLLYRGSSD